VGFMLLLSLDHVLRFLTRLRYSALTQSLYDDRILLCSIILE